MKPQYHVLGFLRISMINRVNLMFYFQMKEITCLIFIYDYFVKIRILSLYTNCQITAGLILYDCYSFLFFFLKIFTLYLVQYQYHV